MESELPEAVKYSPRAEPYLFKLRAGEQTPYWIKADVQNVIYWSEDGCQYEAHYANGRVVKKGEKISMNMATNFKFHAISDCTQAEGGVGVQLK